MSVNIGNVEGGIHDSVIAGGNMIVSDPQYKGGQVQSYIHSTATEPGKGGAIVKVLCQTDFASRTEQFTTFVKQAARLAYGASAAGHEVTTWTQVREMFPELEEQRKHLSEELGEKILLANLVVLTVS
jgi:translation elongation factor EF-Ts